jgi:hypothetical protein
VRAWVRDDDGSIACSITTPQASLGVTLAGSLGEVVSVYAVSPAGVVQVQVAHFDASGVAQVTFA